MPFFSITIPVYNVGKYIRQCLDSVIEQTFIDFEVIILDDGSTDDSGNICDEYAQKDSRVKVIHDKNMGLLMARRRALQYVKGEYVLFLDSDDYWEKDLLENIYNVLTEEKGDMVFFRYRAVDAEGKELYQQKKLLKDKELIRDAGKFLCYKLATSFEYNSMVLKAIKREKIDIEADYSDVKDVSMGEDALQSAMIVSNIENMIYLDRPFYNYRVNISSISTKITEKHLQDYLKVRTVIDDAMSSYYSRKSSEYLQKMEYDIRGFVGLLADMTISPKVTIAKWNIIKDEIISSILFKNILLYKKQLNIMSKIYLFAILNCKRWVWKFLAYIKKILKYLYDRQEG